MRDFNIDCKLYSMAMDPGLDRLIRSNDPSLQKMLEDRVRAVLRAGGKHYRYTLPRQEFIRLTRTYGEQYVADAGADLDQYFDIVNGRLFSRTIPTQMVVLYLFGSGSHYRPNVGALSAAGEAIAGYCVEQFGYRAMVRPLGVMPDAVVWANRAGALYLALVEAKASTRNEPKRIIEKNAADFFVDIKTRAQGFGHRYEGYLIASQFHDGGIIDCVCLHVDLSCYSTSRASAAYPGSTIHVTVPGYDEPVVRVQSIIRLQADTAAAEDEYLTSLLSEEASRSAMIHLLSDQKSPAPKDVEAYIFRVASEIGLEKQWAAGQNLIREVKAKETEHITKALTKFRQPTLELD